MLRIAMAIASLGCTNLQNMVHLTPPRTPTVYLCGSARDVPLPAAPRHRDSGNDCALSCHAACRRAEYPDGADEQ